jgi:transposase InsO family protein
MDLFSRMIVGYTLSDKADTAFVAETVEVAFHSRGKPKDLMFHSDSGIQYTSKEFFRLLKSKDITQSVSRPGTPLDNAVAESFFATFKKEELYHREYHSYEELKKGIDEYVSFYNQVRPHKKLKYVSPCEFEESYYKNLQ